ncbi:MAG: hypothetical protein IPK81_22420 [Rhodospirillales bacterium]|nr:MAG: hypothetical protein IPK81_22420 [Rhodospirillales bacterium]
MSGGDPVPAVREDAATGDIARLYADIRATLGVPVVNLVWRHLATIPGALEWSWNSVRPVYLDGAAAGAAAALRDAMPLVPVAGLPRDALRAAGVDAAAETAIRGVLASYDRSNTMNLLTLSALRARIDGVPAEPAPALHAGGGNDAPDALPPLLARDEMAPETWRLVLRLNALGARDDGRIVASMYRHLAHWPPFLALLWTTLSPPGQDGRLVAAIDGVQSLAVARAPALIGRLAPPAAAPSTAALDATRRALDDFIVHAIGKMVPVCRSIRLGMEP